MIYKDIKIKNKINSINQIIEDTSNYERFFKVEQDDVVVDIGAHVGFFSKNHINKASKIYCVEPDPLFFEELIKTKSEKIKYINAGIVDSSDDTIYIESNGNANSVNTESIGTKVNGITFREFIIENNLKNIDFLKVDCEGGEYSIFNKQNIKWIKQNVNKIAAEFHIHTQEHKILLHHVLYLFDQYKFAYIITDINGNEISKNLLLEKINYYKEVIFYIKPSGSSITLPKINYNYINGCFVELLGGSGVFNVKFIDSDTNIILYQTDILPGHYAKCSFEYFVPYKILVSQNDEIIYNIPFSYSNLKVFISIESKSLGDTLAWIPFADEFRKKHDCKVVVSTFMNDLFKTTYSDLEFAEPGQRVQGVIAQYNIGWFYNEDENINRFKNPVDPKKHPLQSTACDILGLNYKPIKPKLELPKVEKTKKVTLGIHSTAQAKYWNNPNGWEDVCNFVKELQYEPVIVSKEGDGFMGNSYPSGVKTMEPGSINKVIEELCSSVLFVGVGSGLSWLAWACNIPVILISGFSEKYTEMPDCIRIEAQDGKCSGCFNRFKLNPSNWNWCPEHENTDRQFECTKTIDSFNVIKKIQEILK